MEEAHAAAYAVVATYIEERVIQNMEVIQLSHLTLLYRECLEDTEFRNDDYRAENLKV